MSVCNGDEKNASLGSPGAFTQRFMGAPLTLIRLDAARILMRATDSLLRRGKRLYPERWLVKELSEVTPGVTGPPWGMWGVLGERVSISSGQRKARPRARGSTICQKIKNKIKWQFKYFVTNLWNVCVILDLILFSSTLQITEYTQIWYQTKPFSLLLDENCLMRFSKLQLQTESKMQVMVSVG